MKKIVKILSQNHNQSVQKNASLQRIIAIGLSKDYAIVFICLLQLNQQIFVAILRKSAKITRKDYASFSINLRLCANSLKMTAHLNSNRKGNVSIITKLQTQMKCVATLKKIVKICSQESVSQRINLSHNLKKFPG